jgi:hypothetical protein
MPAPARLDAPLETAAVLEVAPVLDHGVIDLAGLDALIGALAADDREVIGPVVRSGAVALGRIRSVADLPAGVGDEQEAGRYRLRRRDDGALFGWAVGAHSWRAQLFPARSLLWEAARTDGTGAGADFAVTGGPRARPPLRLRRRALLRPARHRHLGPGVPGRRPPRPDLRRAPPRRRGGGGALLGPGGHLLLHLHGHRAPGAGRLRPRPHRAPRRRPPRAAGGGRHRAGPRPARRAAAPPRHRGGPGRVGTGERGGGRAHRAPRPAARHRRHRHPAHHQPGPPPLGRRGRAVPGLHELHAGVPDVLLLHGGGHHRPDRRARAAVAALGLLLHARALVPAGRHRAHRPPRAVPAVADPQAGHLDRPARQLGVRGLRALRHLVPRGHRPDRGGGRHPSRAGRDPVRAATAVAVRRAGSVGEGGAP